MPAFLLQSSTEPTVWALAQFIIDNFGNISWYPNWYLGFPFYFIQAPLLPYLLAILRQVTGFEIYTLDFMLVAFGIFSSASGFFVFTKALIKNNFSSFLIGLLSIFILIGLFLFAGSGARILGLGILPWALLFFWKAVSNFTYKRAILASISISLLFLTNNVTTLSFFLAAFALLLSESLKKDSWQKVKYAAVIILASFGLVAFWYTPSNLANIAFSPSISGIPLARFVKVLAQLFIVAIGPIIAVISLKFSRQSKNQPLVFSIFWLFLFAFITLLFYFSNPNFFTEYSRFFPEILIGIGIFSVLILSRYNVNFFNFRIILLFYFGISLLFFLLISHQFSKIDFGNYTEKQIANWLSQNSDGKRIYLSGSTAFWLNYFAPNILQVRGGVDESSTNPVWADASYQIRVGNDPELAYQWLRVLRVSYLVVHHKNSKEFYHDFENPEKFLSSQTRLVEVYDNGKGDKIYKILNPTNLASIVNLSQHQQLIRPQNGEDFEAISGYVNWLEAKEKPVEFDFIRSDQIRLKIPKLDSNEAISVGVTYDPGWKAQSTINHQSLIIKPDVMGQMLIIPQNLSDNSQIILEYKGRIDRFLGYAITLLTVLSLASSAFFNWKIPKAIDRIFGEEDEKY